MKTRFVASGFRSAVVLLCLAVGVATPGLARNPTTKDALVITLYSDRYVAEGQVFFDSDTLDAWVQDKRPSALFIDVCDPAANVRLLETAHRFRDIYLELRPMVTGQAACSPKPTAGVVRVSGAVRPALSNDAQAVDLYWRGVMP